MLRIAIAEDDDQEAKVLNGCLNKYAQEHKSVFSIQRFSDGAAFLSAEKAIFDLVFMDVEMPFMDGLKTAEKLREKDSQTVLVFVTKLFQYAVNGYEYNAADYIIKPIRFASFSLKMEKIGKRCQHDTEKYIQLKYSGGFKRLPLSALSYVELQGHRIVYHTDDGELVYYDLSEQFQNAMNKSRIEVLDLYVYNISIAGGNFSFGTAVSMLKSLISLTLLLIANGAAKLIRGSSIF